MNRILYFTIAAVLSLPFIKVSAETAESVYYNGRVYTVDDNLPWAQALAIQGSRLVYVGDDKTVKEYVGDETQVVDLQGRMVMPGIHDAHTHLLWAGQHLNYGCKFPSDATLDEMLATLQDCAAGRPEDEWLVAGLFQFGQFPDNRPHKSHLDKAFPSTPVYLREGSFHHGLLNSRALELAGIDENTIAPYGGEIRKDAAGNLTGELVEAATVLVDSYLPVASKGRNLAALRWAVAVNNQYGITSVQEASAQLPTLETLAALETEGGLTLRVAAHLIWGSPKFGGMTNEGLEQLIEGRKRYESTHVDVDFIKIWVDGSPTPPYFTQSDVLAGNDGIEVERLLFAPATLNDAVMRFDRMGLKVKLHVAGDGATRAALDAIEAARKANPDSNIRHELGHTNLVTPADMSRFAALNTIAEMSPSVWHLYGRLLGDPPRDAWEFRTLYEHGARLTIGTDWVVTPTPNLFPALEGMLDRGDESIDLAAALRAMTLNGAFAAGWEGSSGSLQAGKYANFVVLDRNLFDIPVSAISETQVLRTVFEGRTVYSADRAGSIEP